MRLVIETSDAERSSLSTFLKTFNGPPTYSALFRTLLQLAMTGKIPKKLISEALTKPRPVLNVSLATPTKHKEGQAKTTKPSHGWDIK